MPGSRGSARADVERYYAAVARFYREEMDGRPDLHEWVALARRLAPRRILDLGCGGGRVGAAIARGLPRTRVVGVDVQRALVGGRPPLPFVQGDMRALPFRDATFDLVVAANDPFAHLLSDADRVRAVGEARRVATLGGRVVIDGIRLRRDEARAAATELRRERRAPSGLVVRERWHRERSDRYEVCFDYVRADRVTEVCARTRTWRLDEPALGGASRLADDLRGSRLSADGDRIVITFAR